ncbi:MAG TPA: dihydrofolate reductase [Usitatibacter sp.]|nr:dihydrofolate reductase [Usitatibacter sp.]
MIRSLVVAVARNGVIGRDNQLPWRLPADLAYFKRVTMGHPVIMGRRTYESIGKPLAGRTNIVVTHNPNYEAPGCIVVNSLKVAWEAAGEADEACVIGGTMLFAESLPMADRIHLTEVEADVEGDTYFPPFDRGQWVEQEVARHPADARHQYPFRIVVLERRSAR